MPKPAVGAPNWGTTLNTFLDSLVVSVEDFGADRTGATDSTTAIRNAAASVSTGGFRLYFPPGNYLVSSVASGASLLSFTGRTGIVIDAATATLTNPTSYTADELTPMFLFNGCTGVSVTLKDYVGYELPAPATYLGSRGATLVRCINACRDVKVNARITNARYGVQTGEYGDATKGQCSGFDVRVTGSMVGYPLAAYYASAIRHDIDVDGVHRAVYIAGCDDVRGVARWKDQYIADIAYLITDCLTAGTDAAAQADPGGAPTSSRGCSNIDVVSIDKGSTVFELSSACAGIALSRVDACAFHDIRVRARTGSATVGTSQRVGLFKVASDAKTIWSRYAFNWESTVRIRGLKVSGVMDHSAQTGEGNTAGGIYVNTYESSASHAATLSDITFENLVLLESSGNTRDLYWNAPGLTGPAVFRNCDFSSLGINVFTNATAETVFDNCKTSSFISPAGGRFALRNSIVGSITGSTTPPANAGSEVGGAAPTIRQKETTLTGLTGATVTWTNAIPNGCVVLGVQGRVQVEITGATGYEVGVATDLTKYVNTNTLTAGSTFGPANASVAGATPHPAQATTSIVVTAKTSNFTAGSLRLILTYLDFSAPTS